MTAPYVFSEAIDLHVPDRISAEDARRQGDTAREILRRFQSQPGLILADEVGMGKTFVALAVAVSVAMADTSRRPVVVMVPPSLKEKWPRDYQLFAEKCLRPPLAVRPVYGSADRAVDFLKLLDDPPERSKSLIFLTHGAMYRALTDGWVKLAVIQRTIRKRWNTGNLRRALCRVMGQLIGMRWVHRHDASVWEALLSADPSEWLRVLRKHGIDPEGDSDSGTDDDPVPVAVLTALDSMNTDQIYQALQGIPYRRSKNFDSNLEVARATINGEMKALWGDCLRNLRVKLPLLILDEAHHLKNRETQFASLFQVADAQGDAEELSNGPLAGMFERMLFLTATPFQLGHHELCSVLDRFEAISWDSQNATAYSRAEFKRRIGDLRGGLDEAQTAALRLDEAWGRLTKADLVAGGRQFGSAESWWESAVGGDSLTEAAGTAIRRFGEAKDRMRSAEAMLKPWVIRHLKPKKLPSPFDAVDRRKPFVGRAIVSGASDAEQPGLGVDKDSLLHFLLAARATACMPESRPVFAEGLASSYEAFLQTRRKCDDATDLDDETVGVCEAQDLGAWYLDRLESILKRDAPEKSLSHPKVAATVNKAIDLWKQGEKVLIFCHYVVTGRILRQRLSEAVTREILQEGASRLGCSPEEAAEELERIGRRFFDEDSPVRRACDAEVKSMLGGSEALWKWSEDLVGVVRRYFRTPSFLVRFFPLGRSSSQSGLLSEAFDRVDGSGLSLRQILDKFFLFLTSKCGERDREKYIEAVKSIQPGSIFGSDVASSFDDDELQGDRTERLVPNVRLVNGQTKAETRQRLMLTFNTPFYPEILVASSVMAEGVDLHLNCRHVIHHDLCWNPSTLEQRTGRVDRIGSKGEVCGMPIHVYIPYVSETQDEKMYRVVMDRERWFKVVMGEKFKVDARTAEKYAERLLFPEQAAEELLFRLEVTS